MQWIRAYVQPSPSVNVYRIFEDPDNSQSSWYLVVEVPQGLQAYMARDHRFYKRVGNIVQPMEQYEVSDVMNRMRGASLTLQMNTVSSQRSLREERITIPINVAITSSNFVSSEYGALKFIIAWPATFPEGTEVIFGRVSRDTGLSLEGYSDTPSAESMFLRWGANMGTVIFPESWHDFNRNAIRIAVPNPSLVPNPTYLVFTELFTINSQSKKALYALKQKGDSIDFEIIEVRTEDYSSIVADYWHSFHQAYRSGFSTS